VSPIYCDIWEKKYFSQTYLGFNIQKQILFFFLKKYFDKALKSSKIYEFNLMILMSLNQKHSQTVQIVSKTFWDCSDIIK
jgi:hypothetical protein